MSPNSLPHRRPVLPVAAVQFVVSPDTRAALAKAEQHGQALAAELDAARETGRQAEAAAMARAEATERARKAAVDELRATEALVAQARVEAERFQKVPGLRGRVVRWLAR